MKATKRTRRAAPKAAVDVRARALLDAVELVRVLAGSYTAVTVHDATDEFLNAVEELTGGKRQTHVSSGRTWVSVRVNSLDGLSGLSVCGPFSDVVEAAS